MNDLWITTISAIGAATIGAFLGAYLNSWFKRDKPWIGLSSIDRDDSTMVEISEDINDIYRKSTYFNTEPLTKYEPLYKLRNEIGKIDGGLSQFRNTLRNIDSFLAKLRSGIHTELDKRQSLTSLFQDPFFMSILQFLNSTNNLQLSKAGEETEESDGIFQLEKYEDKPNKQFGVILYGERSRYYITIQGIVTQEALQRTHRLGATFSSFDETNIISILERMKDYLNNEIQLTVNLKDKIESLIISRRLLVKVKVSNTGGTPVHIEPYGFLKVNSTGKRVKPLLLEATNYKSQEPGTEELSKMMQLFEGMASKMGVESSYSPSVYRTAPEYIIVNPGSLIEIELFTIENIVDPEIVYALESGILSSQVILKKASSAKNQVLRSSFQTMGITISDEKIKELSELSENLKN